LPPHRPSRQDPERKKRLPSPSKRPGHDYASAVEDLIKRLAQQMSEIKEAKADVRAHKKEISIGMRVVLSQETHIPDFTARLQDLIATKIQEVFGIDEAINVKIHVAKIVSGTDKNNKKRQEPPREEISIPYQGIKI
jgi:uncharacterized alkaline shock family protein YloU